MCFINGYETYLLLDCQTSKNQFRLPEFVEKGLGCGKYYVVLSLCKLPHNQWILLEGAEEGDSQACGFECLHLIHGEADRGEENHSQLSSQGAGKLEAQALSTSCWLYNEGMFASQCCFDDVQLPIPERALLEILYKQPCKLHIIIPYETMSYTQS